MMAELYRHLVFVLATLMVVGVTAALAGGLVWMWAALCILLFIWLIIYWWHLVKLMRWLERPKLRNVPQGFGIWQVIFKILMAQAKSRKKRKQKLGVALLRFNRIAETIPNGVLILGNDGRIQWFNHLAAEHLGLNPESCRDAMLSDLIDQMHLQPFLCAAEDEASIRLSIMTPSGLPRLLNIIRTPFEDQAILLITEDVTAAEQLNATRTAFVANVSHELRTPLTVINGFLETLAEMPALPLAQRQEFVSLMRKEGERMNQLLADLLTLSRLENQAVINVTKERVCLSELVRQLLQDAKNISNRKHQFEDDIGTDIWIEGVSADLYSALGNLLFNAVRYTPEGGHIMVSLQSGLNDEGGLQARFRVQDTGPGIAAEHLPHLTERFYRVDKGRSRQSGGTGLGLAIAKHALAEHGGVLHIESQVGKGSIFTACIPQTATELPENGDT